MHVLSGPLFAHERSFFVFLGHGATKGLPPVPAVSRVASASGVCAGALQSECPPRVRRLCAAPLQIDWWGCCGCICSWGQVSRPCRLGRGLLQELLWPLAAATQPGQKGAICACKSPLFPCGVWPMNVSRGRCANAARHFDLVGAVHPHALAVPGYKHTRVPLRELCSRSGTLTFRLPGTGASS
jgi:hypothetical protein